MINDFRSKTLDPGYGDFLGANKPLAAAVPKETEATDGDIEELEKKVQLGEILSWKQWGIIIRVNLRRDKEAASSHLGPSVLDYKSEEMKYFI
jgi:hypothetical protein